MMPSREGPPVSVRTCVARRARVTLVCGAVAVLVCGSALRSAGASAAGGADLYHTYCASCHGWEARGNGADAHIFARPPRDLRSGFLQRYPMRDLIRRVRDGDPLTLALDPAALRQRATDVEALVRYLGRLPAVNWRLADKGEELFLRRCTSCHGIYGHPTAEQPPGIRPVHDLSDPGFQNAVSDDELLTAVRHGRGGMPGLVPRITTTDARALVAFVRLFSPGYELYSQYCANCHGQDGRPSGSFAEASMRPAVVFDGAYFRKADAEKLRASVWHMVGEKAPAMPHYRETLSLRQAQAILTYLKSLR